MPVVPVGQEDHKGKVYPQLHIEFKGSLDCMRPCL